MKGFSFYIKELRANAVRPYREGGNLDFRLVMLPRGGEPNPPSDRCDEVNPSEAFSLSAAKNEMGYGQGLTHPILIFHL